MQKTQAKGNKAIWLVAGALFFIVFSVADNAGCTKPRKTEAEKLFMETMAGPSNPGVQRISSLNTGNAYSAGYNDGMMEVARMAEKASTMQGNMNDQLRTLNEGKSIFFDAVGVGAQNGYNSVNSSVLSEYRRGWNAGWNAGWNTLHRVR